MRSFTPEKASVTCAECRTVVPRTGGKQLYCSSCALRRKYEAADDYRRRHPEKAREWGRRAEQRRSRTSQEHWKRHGRAWTIRRKYGISEADYDALLAAGCAICGGKAEALDHCHTTGAIRGPLCRRCNHGLGHFRDKLDLLKAAIRYLEGA